MPTQYFLIRNEEQVGLAVKYRLSFIDAKFAGIVDSPITQYGREAFLLNLKRLHSAHQHDQVFVQVFKIPFERFLSDWKHAVIQAT